MKDIEKLIEQIKSFPELKALLEQIDLEHEVENAPYESDFFEQRKIIARIVDRYAQLSNNCHRYRLPLENSFFQFLVFDVMGTYYLWFDVCKDGKIEISQLEKLTNKIYSKVIYTTDDKEIPMGPMFFGMLEEHKLESID